MSYKCFVFTGFARHYTIHVRLSHHIAHLSVHLIYIPPYLYNYCHQIIMIMSNKRRHIWLWIEHAFVLSTCLHVYVLVKMSVENTLNYVLLLPIQFCPVSTDFFQYACCHKREPILRAPLCQHSVTRWEHKDGASQENTALIQCWFYVGP